MCVYVSVYVCVRVCVCVYMCVAACVCTFVCLCVHHLPNETKIQKSQQSTFFFDAAEPVGNKHVALASIAADGAPARRHHKTNTVHSLFLFFFEQFYKKMNI